MMIIILMMPVLTVFISVFSDTSIIDIDIIIIIIIKWSNDQY